MGISDICGYAKVLVVDDFQGKRMKHKTRK
jgi:hypothetical protein